MNETLGEFPCGVCDYPLRGLTVDGACPECGAPVMESLGNRSPLRKTSGWSTASMVLGITSVAGCVFYGIPSMVCGPAALITWWLARRQLVLKRAGGSTKPFALTGLITGIVGTVIGAAVAGFIVWVFVGLNQSMHHMQPAAPAAPAPVASPATAPAGQQAPAPASGAPVSP